MITDLVSPWCAAVEAGAASGAEATFRRAHASFLDLLARQRHPLGGELPPGADPAALRKASESARDSALHRTLRAAVAGSRAHGADWPAELVLFPGDGTAATFEALPHPVPTVVLLVDSDRRADQLAAAVARGVSALTRWCDPGSASPVRGMLAPWSRWQLAAQVPLAEWVYTEGVGLHAAAAVAPQLAPHELLGLGPAQFQRIREREKQLRALLRVDFDSAAVDTVNRWLDWSDERGEQDVPAGAGRYLAWRMTGELVAEVGVRRALRLPAVPERS